MSLVLTTITLSLAVFICADTNLVPTTQVNPLQVQIYFNFLEKDNSDFPDKANSYFLVITAAAISSTVKANLTNAQKSFSDPEFFKFFLGVIELKDVKQLQEVVLQPYRKIQTEAFPTNEIVPELARMLKEQINKTGAKFLFSIPAISLKSKENGIDKKNDGYVEVTPKISVGQVSSGLSIGMKPNNQSGYNVEIFSREPIATGYENVFEFEEKANPPRRLEASEMFLFLKSDEEIKEFLLELSGVNILGVEEKENSISIRERSASGNGLSLTAEIIILVIMILVIMAGTALKKYKRVKKICLYKKTEDKE